MPPLPPSNTARYWLDYTYGAAGPRSLQVRYESPATDQDVADWLDVLLGIIDGPMDSSWAITGARKAALGSNVTLPAVTPVGPTPSGGTIAAAYYPYFISGQFRDVTAGNKGKLSVYGLNLVPDNTYRFAVGESTVMDNLLSFLQVPVVGINISIAGNPVQYHDYINAGFNAYHQRKQR